MATDETPGFPISHVTPVEPPVLFMCCDDPTPCNDGIGQPYCEACGDAMSPAQLYAASCAHLVPGDSVARCEKCGLSFCEAAGPPADNTEPVTPEPCGAPATHREVTKSGQRRNVCDRHRLEGQEE